MVPIVREESGLARSSRNLYLSGEEKKAALVLSRSLKKAKVVYQQGERSATALKRLVQAELLTEKMATVDYVELYTFPELLPVEQIGTEVLLAIAVKIGKIRLIDNIILGAEKCC